MKKKIAKQILEIIRNWDAKNINSETRSKLLTNIITLKKVAAEVDETVKSLQESMTEEERQAAMIVQTLQKKMAEEKDYILAEEEKETILTYKKWEAAANSTLSEMLDVEVEIKKLTAAEFDSIVDNNGMSMKQYEMLYELMVEE